LNPPYSPYVLLLFNLSSPLTVSINGSQVKEIGSNTFLVSGAYVLTNGTAVTKGTNLLTDFGPGTWFIEISVKVPPTPDLKSLLTDNFLHVNSWLRSSRFPSNLPKNLLQEYYISLLLLKDDQNPSLGTFAASPSPIYLYSWVRDSAFAAIALQEAGHYNSALKFWMWLSRAEQLSPSVWYTRYNFYDGVPDPSFGIPELDGIGLFEVGVYDFFNLTGNVTFLNQMMSTINQSIKYQLTEINISNFHLLPQDLSVWEDRDAYHFWTEAFNDLGLLDVARIYLRLGLNNSQIIRAENLLNRSILLNFWDNDSFASALGTSVLYAGGKAKSILSPVSPTVDSATLLPLDFGYLPADSNFSTLNFKIVKDTLTVHGGLARFQGDTYHYSNTLYDSSGPYPPWIITTLFEAAYYEETGRNSQALGLLYWAYDHSQKGLLPEALDPNSGLPLPTTSPLTWSSAMFVMASLALGRSDNISLIYLIPPILVIVLLLLWLGKRRNEYKFKDAHSPSQS